MPNIRLAGRWTPRGGSNLFTDMDSGHIHTLEQLAGLADALIIAPGSGHARDLAVLSLKAARHVFLYANTLTGVTDAYQLTKLAREANVILKAGKTGNIDTGFIHQNFSGREEINMIELQHNHRISARGKKGPDMAEALLSDLEIIFTLIRARVISIKAKGMCMLTSRPEIISARIEFDNGCAVNYTGNLVADQDEFTGTVITKTNILKFDLIRGELLNWNVQHPGKPSRNLISMEKSRMEPRDPLGGELTHFFDLIRSGSAFLSLHDNGFEPYLLADRILDRVNKTLVPFS